jgi:hypothetical protein
VRSHRSRITLTALSSAFVLVALSALAHAQNVQCRKTETQAECHARLKCKPNEELEACQKRLLKCTADESLADCQKRATKENAQQQGDPDQSGGERRDDDRSGGERRDRDNADRRDDDRRNDNADRRDDDRGNRDNADRDRDNADRDRDNRDDRGDSRRQRGGRDRGDRRGRRGDGGGGGGFQANKTFGLGLEIGEPTGLNGKLFLSDKLALDFGLGWIYRHYYYGDGAHLYADLLFHPVSLVSASAFELPLYIGGGIRFWDFEYCRARNDCGYGGSAIGIRIPFGISFDFNNVPLDIFIQLVPVIDFIRGDYYTFRDRDRAHFGVDLSLGIRYWFK